MNLRVEIVVKNAFPSIELKFSIIIKNGSIRKKKKMKEKEGVHFIQCYLTIKRTGKLRKIASDVKSFMHLNLFKATK